MEEYYNTKEFRKLLRRYQKARRTGVSDYFMASELGDIIQYYAVQGKNDKAMEVSDFTLNLYPGAVEPLAFKARYALSVEDDPDQAQAYADLVEDKTDVEYYYLVAEILIHKEEIGTMENYLRARYAELSKKDKDEFALDVAQMMDDYRLTELALSWLDLVKDRKHPDYKSIKGKVLVFSGLHDSMARASDCWRSSPTTNPTTSIAGSTWHKRRSRSSTTKSVLSRATTPSPSILRTPRPSTSRVERWSLWSTTRRPWSSSRVTTTCSRRRPMVSRP